MSDAANRNVLLSIQSPIRGANACIDHQLATVVRRTEQFSPTKTTSRNTISLPKRRYRAEPASPSPPNTQPAILSPCPCRHQCSLAPTNHQSQPPALTSRHHIDPLLAYGSNIATPPYPSPRHPSQESQPVNSSTAIGAQNAPAPMPHSSPCGYLYPNRFNPPPFLKAR